PRRELAHALRTWGRARPAKRIRAPREEPTGRSSRVLRASSSVQMTGRRDVAATRSPRARRRAHRARSCSRSTRGRCPAGARGAALGGLRRLEATEAGRPTVAPLAGQLDAVDDGAAIPQLDGDP